MTTRTLDIALISLKRFPWLHLFPVAFDNKAQPLLKDYLKRASNDPAQIRRWHAFWKKQFNGVDCWWGVAPALSGLVFADIDTKPGKRGQETFESFDLLYGWPQTWITGSPSGGRHHWYRGRHLFAIGTDKSSHPGIDFAQYVILPGCMKADGTGYTLLADHPIADAPDWFYVETKRLVDKLEATEQEPVIDFDQPANVDWAKCKGLSDPAGAIDGATHCSKLGDGPLARYEFKATYQRHAVDGFTIVAQLRESGPNVALMSDNVAKLVKLNKRDSQMLDVLRGMEPGTSLAEWQAAVESAKFTDRDGKPLKADALRKAFQRATERLMTADAIEVDGDMVTVKSGSSGNDMVFGTAEEDFLDEDE